MYTSAVVVIVAVVFRSPMRVSVCVCVCVCAVERFTSDVSFGPGDDKIPATATAVHLHPPNRKRDGDNIIINILGVDEGLVASRWHCGSEPLIVDAVSLRFPSEPSSHPSVRSFIIYLFICLFSFWSFYFFRPRSESSVIIVW